MAATRASSAATVAVVVVVVVVGMWVATAVPCARAQPPPPRLDCAGLGLASSAPTIDNTTNATIALMYAPELWYHKGIEQGLRFFVERHNADAGAVRVGNYAHRLELRLFPVSLFDFAAQLDTIAEIACDRSIALNFLAPWWNEAHYHALMAPYKATLGVSLGTGTGVGRALRAFSVLSLLRTGLTTTLRYFALSGARRLGILSDGAMGVQCDELPTLPHAFGMHSIELAHYVAPSTAALFNETSNFTEALTTLLAPDSSSGAGSGGADERGTDVDVLLLCGSFIDVGESMQRTFERIGVMPSAVVVYPLERWPNTPVLEPPMPAFFMSLGWWNAFAGVQTFDPEFGDGDEFARRFMARFADERREFNLTEVPDLGEGAAYVAGRVAASAFTKLSSLGDVLVADDDAEAMARGAERMSSAILTTRLQSFMGTIGFDDSGVGLMENILYQHGDSELLDAVANDNTAEYLDSLSDDERRRRFERTPRRFLDGSTLGDADRLRFQPVLPLEAASSLLIYPQPSVDERESSASWYEHTSEQVIVALTSILLSSFAVALLLFAYFRHSPVLLASSHLFNVTLVLGAALSASTNYVWTLYSNDAACLARPWLLSLGLFLMFGALLAKTFRIFLIFRQLKNVNAHSDRRLYVVGGVLLFVQLVYLIVWSAVAPLESVFVVTDPLRPSTAYYECDGSNVNVWVGIEAAWLCAIIVAAVVMTFFVRHVKMVCFNENRPLLFSVYTCFLTGIILLPLQFAGDLDRELMMWLRAIIILLTTCATVWSLCATKFYLIAARTKITDVKAGSSPSSSTVSRSLASSPPGARSMVSRSGGANTRNDTTTAGGESTDTSDLTSM